MKGFYAWAMDFCVLGFLNETSVYRDGVPICISVNLQHVLPSDEIQMDYFCPFA